MGCQAVGLILVVAVAMGHTCIQTVAPLQTCRLARTSAMQEQIVLVCLMASLRELGATCIQKCLVHTRMRIALRTRIAIFAATRHQALPQPPRRLQTPL